MPTQQHPVAGYLLHPIDLAINKLLALVGRDEPRDFLDIMFAHTEILSLGALCWAAAGKDPGFTPPLLLSLLKRRGRNRPEDLARLHLRTKPDVTDLKRAWLNALDNAEAFVTARPAIELGCLYYSRGRGTFVSDPSNASDIVLHRGQPGGSSPSLA